MALQASAGLGTSCPGPCDLTQAAPWLAFVSPVASLFLSFSDGLDCGAMAVRLALCTLLGHVLLKDKPMVHWSLLFPHVTWHGAWHIAGTGASYVLSET